MSAIVIIPSRYGSTRFPGKPLYHLLGKPLIQHVCERAKKAKYVKDVFVATDNELIYNTVEGFGGKAIMTSDKHGSGSDRIAEAVSIIHNSLFKIQDSDIIVNVQGDEPMTMPEMIDGVIRLMDDERAEIGTLAKRIQNASEVADPNIVKVVFNAEGFALYFSRAPIPYHRDIFKDTGYRIQDSEMQKISMFKHIGIYAFKKYALLKFSSLSPTKLEEIEKLEQLRALENGFSIKVKETAFETIGVDTPMDLERVTKCLSTSL